MPRTFIRRRIAEIAEGSASALFAGVRDAFQARQVINHAKKAINGPGVKKLKRAYEDFTGYLNKNKMAPIMKKRKMVHSKGAVKQSGSKHTPAQTRAAAFQKGKPNTFKKKRNVKLPKGFKMKVEKALEPKEMSGSWKQVSYDTLAATSINTNGQFVAGLGEVSANDYSDWAFDPEDVLHAASVLWNDKADSQTTRPYFGGGNFGIRPPTNGARNPVNGALPQTYYPMDVKITVKNSYEQYKLKNNTQRTIVFKIYLCSPRMQGAKYSAVTAPEAAPAFTVSSTTPTAIGNPGALWQNALAHQAESNVNVAGAVAQTLYQNPKSNPTFNKVYKSDLTVVTLEPGQVYDYYIQGPSNFVYNFNNYFQGDQNVTEAYYMGIQKFMRYPLFTCYQDLITDGDFSGRYTGSEAQAGAFGVAIERIMKFSLAMPEQAGTRVGALDGGATSQQLVLSSRRDCFFHKVYTATGPTGDLQRVDVENPPIEVDQT